MSVPREFKDEVDKKRMGGGAQHIELSEENTLYKEREA